MESMEPSAKRSRVEGSSAVRALPAELWTAVLERSEDWAALGALAQADRRLAAISHRTGWRGVKRLRLSSSPAQPHSLLDLDSRRSLSASKLRDNLLPRLKGLRELSMEEAESAGVGSPPRKGPVTRSAAGAQSWADRGLGAFLDAAWQPRLTSLRLHEGYAAAAEAPLLVASVSPWLERLELLSCHAAAPRSSARLWSAIRASQQLRHLAFGFCSREPSTLDQVAEGLAGHPRLDSLCLRGLNRLTPQGLLTALGHLKGQLRSFALESTPYTNDFFSAASLATAELRAPLAGLKSFRMNKCGFIYAPLILAVMPELETLRVALADAGELVKLALSFVLEYAGSEARPRHFLRIDNDLEDLRLKPGQTFRPDQLLSGCQLAIRRLRKKFRLFFDVSLVELPVEGEGEVLTTRLALAKGRTLVFLDTRHRHHLSLGLPKAQPAPTSA